MVSLLSLMPEDWRELLSEELSKPYWAGLEDFIRREFERGEVFPPVGEMFSAFHLTPCAEVRALILGQDPYHDHGQAHGLSFSVREGVALPPSLRNIYKELNNDLGLVTATGGSLVPWARQGVLLLNTSLTVRAHEPASHSGKGWELFTDAVIAALGKGTRPLVFVLWGAHAAKKAELVDESRHLVIRSAHPSPLSARRGFFGSRPFSRINAFLERHGQSPVSWGVADCAGQLELPLT